MPEELNPLHYTSHYNHIVLEIAILFPPLLAIKQALKRYPYFICSSTVNRLFMFYSTCENCTIYNPTAEYYNYNPMINTVFAISISIRPIKFSLL
jgi:hypothetical protein